MTRKQTLIALGTLALVSLAIGIIWTVRTAPPSANPWWAGKDARVRVEVWEPGKDMATVAMTVPKKTVDTMMALGMKAAMKAGHYEMDLRDYWKQIQALPKGEKLIVREGRGTMYIWIETPDMKPDTIRAEGA